MAYDLEWGSRILGSIKGGSNHKYGYEADFPKIKSIIGEIISIDSESAYRSDGGFSDQLNRIVRLSKDINGFKTGRTVLPKLLSIYYPETFLPIFNDQDLYVSRLIIDGLDSENTGLAMYLEYNYKLLIAKTRLEDVTGRVFNNFEYASLLYHLFPKGQTEQDIAQLVVIDRIEDRQFEALEVQHYQTLLHRNFKRLFQILDTLTKKLRFQKMANMTRRRSA